MNRNEREAIRDNINMTPKVIFETYLRRSYGLTSGMANEAAEFAIDLFQLDDNGKLPIEWDIWYKGQA